MGFYARHIVPRLVDFSMRQERLAAYRGRVLSGAHGRVLEIGIGSGRNLRFYPDAVEAIVGVEPSPELLRMAREADRRLPRKVRFLKRSAESLPLDNDTRGKN